MNADCQVDAHPWPINEDARETRRIFELIQNKGGIERENGERNGKREWQESFCALYSVLRIMYLIEFILVTLDLIIKIWNS